MSGKVVHFEIPVDDGERGVAFYREAFGWDLERWGQMEFWTTAAGEGEGIGGALTKRGEESPALIFYIAVDDIDAALRAVEEAGGRRLSERMPIPVGRLVGVLRGHRRQQGRALPGRSERADAGGHAVAPPSPPGLLARAEDPLAGQSRIPP